MATKMMILDKNGNPIAIHELPPGWKLSPFERDRIFQKFVAQFASVDERRGILREFLKEEIRNRAFKFFESEARDVGISADRIHAFVSEAVASEVGVLPKSERWDWWVGCSLINSPSASSAPPR